MEPCLNTLKENLLEKIGSVLLPVTVICDGNCVHDRVYRCDNSLDVDVDVDD